MAQVDVEAALGGALEFVAEAVEQLAPYLGDAHPTVAAGRRVMASLAAIPEGAVLVTEDSLAAALRRAWPIRRQTPSATGLSAAVLLAALRAEP